MKLYVLIGLLFMWQGSSWADITVQLDHSQVKFGETFHLIFNINDPSYQGVPDLTPLQKNFKIIGTERSIAYNIVNGQTHTINQWIILLSPKKKGTLTIPALTLGSQRTAPSQIEVVANQSQSTSTDDADADDKDVNDEVVLKVEVTPEKAYVNQQIIYTIRLYNAQQLMDAEYQPPKVEDALIVPLGSGRRYQTYMHRRHYVVEEQQYAIFPQKSGPLKIIAPTFRALIFDMQPQRITRHPKPTMLSVKPVPSDMNGKHWLPAKQLSLTETYSQSDTNLKQGTTLLRTVTLQASGAPAELLPTLNFVCKDDVSCYPDKPVLQNSAHQQTLIGRAEVKVTYLFNKAGSVTLPAIEIPWFNTDSNRVETATLPGRTLVIAAPDQANNLQAPAAKVPATVTSKNIAPPPPLPASVSVGWWVALGFAIAWVLTLLLWWFYRNIPVGISSQRRALKWVKQACLKNDPKETQTALLRWASLKWSHTLTINLNQLSQLITDNTLKKELNILSQAIYGAKSSQKWSGAGLWRALRTFLRSKSQSKKTKKARTLPPINP